MTASGSRQAMPALSGWKDFIVPAGALALFALTVGVVLAAAGSTLGYDYNCYAGAAQALRDGRPIYDVAYSVDVGNCPGTFTYPPPFAAALVPWLSLGGAAAGLWCLAMAACFIAGVAALPVRRDVRWLVVIVAALDWPLLYAIKLGQVEPILFLLFALSWRWIDSAAVVGTATAIGAVMKVQPALIGVWALATRRWRAAALSAGVAAALAISGTLFTGAGAWADYVELLRRLGGTLTTPHNFAPGAVARMAGLPADAATLLQLASAALAVLAVIASWRYTSPEVSLQIAILGSQLISSPLRDHYAVLLLLPVAFLVERGWTATIVLPLLGWLALFAFPASGGGSWLAAASVPAVMFGGLGLLFLYGLVERRAGVAARSTARAAQATTQAR